MIDILFIGSMVVMLACLVVRLTRLEHGGSQSVVRLVSLVAAVAVALSLILRILVKGI